MRLECQRIIRRTSQQFQRQLRRLFRMQGRLWFQEIEEKEKML